MLYENSWDSTDKAVTRKPWALILIMVFMLLTLSLRLFYIQVLNHNIYLSKSNTIRIKREVIEAPRGIIYDCNGEIFAENYMSYAITVDPLESDQIEESIFRLATLVPDLHEMLEVPRSEVADFVKQRIRRKRNPEKIIRDADFRLLSIVEENNLDLPGIGTVFDQRRHYPHGSLASHVIGYMGEPSRQQYDLLKDRGYELGQTIGVHGIEKYYENTLKGENGAKFVEMNYLNRMLGITSEQKPITPIAGKDITLTLDIRLQEIAEEAFGDSIIGSLVALDPRTGGVLVMASAPSFDPNEFTGVMTPERVMALNNDPDKPLFNRAIQATYPPGSPYKLITVLSGLQNGISEDTTFNSCNGSYYFGRTYHCWKEEGHGVLNMEYALINSCNVYMYQLARKLSLEKWTDTATLLDLGKKTGIDLQGEESGTLPNQAYYTATNVAYSPGMILNLAIGQGENLATILQLAHYTGIIASEGVKATPHLVKTNNLNITNVEGVSPESFQLLKKGMRGVVHDPQGTAKTARIPGHIIGAKTGTAQNPHGADHKLFIAFAPYDNPTIAIACVAENAGDYEGSLAIQIGKKVLQAYFDYYPDPTVVPND